MSNAADLLTRAIRLPPEGLGGDLVVPENATGLVIFAHGSGSSRNSSRNRFFARHLNSGGLATFLMDLLTEAKEQVDIRTRHLRFDIDLLAGRLVNAAEWAAADPDTRGLRIGYFGASTGGGAALVAAAAKPGASPCLRSDLFDRWRRRSSRNRTEQAGSAQLRCEKRLEIVPGATHLFEEPGTLEQVAELARGWFRRYLAQ